MSEDENWGPWTEHNGGGCPCVGAFVHVVLGDAGADFPIHGSGMDTWDEGWSPLNEAEAVGIARQDPSWEWDGRSYPVIRYRIRKPKGLTILEALLEDLPTTVDA